MLAKELGYVVEAVQTGFPDCEAMRQITPERWQRVHIEFEFESRNFRDHGHPPTGCDVIVCWRHNWDDCPEGIIEVVELSSIIKSLVQIRGLTKFFPVLPRSSGRTLFSLYLYLLCELCALFPLCSLC